MRARRGAMALACAVASLGATQAHAAIPQGNTLLNGDGETGAPAVDEASHQCPQGWTCDAANANLTLIRYGAATFPSAAEAARIGGGRNLFAGGPANNLSSATQDVDLGEQPEFDEGTVKATFGGCLGGFGDQVDRARLELTFLSRENPDGIGLTSAVDGPTASTRGNRTTLRPVASTVAVPPITSSFRFRLVFAGETGGYNSGYADNLSVTFGAATGPNPPAPPCVAPAGGGGGGGGGPTPDGGPDGKDKEVKLLRFGPAILGAGGKARVRVTCATTQLRRCKGSLSASLVRTSKRRGTALRLGRVTFSVPSRRTRTITLRFGRSARAKVAGLSRRALAGRRVRLRATTKVGVTRLSQTSVLRVKRSR